MADKATILPQATGPNAPAAPAKPAAPAAPAHQAAESVQTGGVPSARIAPQGEAPPRPSWLPAKFKSPEDMAAAYAQLEQRMGSQPAIQPSLDERVAPEGANLEQQVGGHPAIPAQPQAPAAAQHAGLIQELTNSYAQGGQVPPELRQRFVAETGLPEHFIDNQIAYMRGQEQTAMTLAKERLGGESAVSELLQWASRNVEPAEREAFNRAIYSGDPAVMGLALDGLASRYEATMGRSPKRVAGSRPMPEHGGTQPFQSNAEWTAARRDPRYKADPAFRNEVTRRAQLAMQLNLL